MELYPIQLENQSVSVVDRSKIRDTFFIGGLNGQPNFVGTTRAVSNYKDTIFIGLFKSEVTKGRNLLARHHG